MLFGISAAVVGAGAIVTPQAFAGTLPGFGRDGTRAGFFGFGNRNGSGSGAAADSGGDCSDVQLVFARGTGEPQGLGIVGRPLAQALASELPDQSVSSFAVVYAAASNQRSAGPGATNMSQHIAEVAADCPQTRFVIGGYSQGASVTDIAIGIRNAGTAGEAIPENLNDRVAAVVVFGNPLGLRRQTIAQNSPEFGPKAKEFCNTGDPVCGGGNNFAAHLAYPRNGSVQEAAEFAAGKLG
ncbi:cutinase [Actinoplanes italicus]|nr:cutinase [Actinoplanes italicus]